MRLNPLSGWKLDNTISVDLSHEWNAPVRITGIGLHIFDQGLQAIVHSKDIKNDHFIGTMDIIRVGSRIYTFFVHQSPNSELGPGAKIFYRTARLGDSSRSSCTGPDNPQHNFSLESDTTGCLDWGGIYPIYDDKSNNFPSSKGLSAIVWDSHIFVASWNDNNSVTVYEMVRSGRSEETGTLGLIGSQIVVPVGTGNQGKPELAIIYSNAADWTQRLALVYNNPRNSAYEAYYWDGHQFVFWQDFGRIAPSSPPNANADVVLTGSGNPTLVAWPDRSNTLIDPTNRITCGIFPTQQQGMRPFCLNPYTLTWADFSDTAFANLSNSGTCPPGQTFDPAAGSIGRCLLISNNPPELSMRYLRKGTGEPFSLNEAHSNFQLTWTSQGSLIPGALIFTPVSVANHPLLGQWTIGVGGQDFIRTNAYEIVAGTNVPMYEDRNMGGMFAISVSDADNRIEFYPHADGSVNMDFWAGNDFQTMENYVCMRKPEDFFENISVLGFSCGSVNVFP